MPFGAKILLFVFWAFSVATPLYGQYQPHLPDLRECEVFNCTANNFTIQSVYLSDINGVPITNTVRSCSPWQTMDVYISIKYSSNSGSAVDNGRILADLEIGDSRIFINYFVGVLVPSTGMTITLVDEDLKLSWSCGDAVNLVNPHTIYTTTSTVDHSVSYTCSANSYGKSQCGSTTSVSVTTPHILDYEFSQSCTVDGETPVAFVNTSRGGSGVYQYSWEFVTGNGSVSTTDIEPEAIYFGDGTATLAVRDENGELLSTYTRQVTLRDTQVVNPFTSVTINQTDTVKPNGAIILDVVRPGNYTYLWTGPDDFHSEDPAIYGLKDGIYEVTVTDEFNCVFVYEFQLPAFVTLPLAMDFTGARYNQTTGGVELSWQIMQTNQDFSCVIQRSYEGIEAFENVAMFDREASKLDSFEFIDFPPNDRGGRYYYRILVEGGADQKDSSYSEIRMVQVPLRSESAEYWRLFPNPTSGNVLFLEYTGKRIPFAEDHRLQVRVHSAISGTVWVWEGEIGRVDLSESLSRLSKGVFFVEVYHAGHREVFKVIR